MAGAGFGTDGSSLSFAVKKTIILVEVLSCKRVVFQRNNQRSV